MEEEVFAEPLARLVSLLKSPSGNASATDNELMQFLWAQRAVFVADRFMKVKARASQTESDRIRADLKSKKQFTFGGRIIEVIDEFLTIAFQLSDRLQLDEYLSCQVLAHVVEMTSSRDANTLLDLSEDFIYHSRSCYLDTLRRILDYLNEENGEKNKMDILQNYICDLLSTQDCIATVLLRTLEEKIRNITVPTNLRESGYRVQECIKITECLFLLSFQFTLKEESIRSILQRLKEASRLYSNQTQTSTFYAPLFQITYSLMLNVFVLFVEPKVSLMNPIERKPSINTELTSSQFLDKIQTDINTDWEHNLPIQSTLKSLFYLMRIKEEYEDFDQYLLKAFPQDRNGAEFLAKVVEAPQFKSSALVGFYYYVLDEYACNLIQVFQIDKKNQYLPFLNSFNQFLTSIYSNGAQSSKKFWEFSENCGYLKMLWLQLPNPLIITSFRMMGALTVCNGIEVYNFFTKDSSQFTWNKILQHMQFYVEGLNQPNTELSPNDTEALNAFLCLITEVINYSPHLAQMLSRSTSILQLFFRYITAPVSVGLKSTTLKAITACAKYQAYVPEIWRLLNESQIFPAGLRMESQSSEHGEFPFTQQFLELFYQLIQASPFLFDRSNDRLMSGYLEHIMNLFSSFNNKAFINIQDKWRFTLTILNIFVFCLSQFKHAVVNHHIDRSHPVYALYLELTKDSHNLTLKTIIAIIETASNEDITQANEPNELFQMTLCRCLDILLFVSDSTVYSVEDARSTVTHLSSMKSSPIISIAKLVDHANKEIGLKALRLIYSFEVYTQRISTLFLASPSADALLEKFVKVLDFSEPEQEDYTGGFYQQESHFQQYGANSIQWTIAQLILFCLEKTANNSNYTLAHFLLGCPSTYDLSQDFEINARTCLSVIIKKMSTREFVARYPHLNDCYHDIVHKMTSNPATSRPMIKYLKINYYRDSIALLKQQIAEASVPGSERLKGAHISSLSWLLKTMAITGHTTSDLSTKAYFSSLLGGQQITALDNQAPGAIQVLSLFNIIDFTFPELQKPRIFEMSPVLESTCLTTYRDCQVIDLPLLRKHLEKDSRYPSTAEIEKELETCARLNAFITLLGSKTRALEGWKQFVNDSFLQLDLIMSIDEVIPLELLQRLAMEFFNERYPVACGVSIGYTILTLLSVLKIKKNSYPLNTFNEVLETKIKGIFEGLLQTVLRSPYQPIRGIAYTAIINYLQLTQEEQQQQKDHPLGSSTNGTTSSIRLGGHPPQADELKSMERYNLILITKVEDRFIRILSADCNSFSSGWKIAALTCLQMLVAADPHRGNRTLRFIEDKGLIGSVVQECARLLGNSWEKVGMRELRVYEAQMSLLLQVSQQQDGVRVLMNNNIINCLQQCHFFNHMPTEQDTADGIFLHLLIPALRLLAGLFLLSNDRLDVHNQISTFVATHSDLFKVILQDSHQHITTSTLSILQLTVFIYAQISKHASIEHQVHLNKTHSLLLALLSKYSKTTKSTEVVASSDEEIELKSRQQFNNIVKEKKSLFDVDVKTQITLLCRDILLYCRRVSILSDSKFGTICFTSNVSISKIGATSGSLPSMDLPLKYLVDSLIDYNQSAELITFLTYNNDNVEQLSNVQYKQILAQDDELYFNITQRNQMVQQKLGQMLAAATMQRSVLVENIESLLLLVVSHAFYYSCSVSYLFTHPVSTSSPELLSSSQQQRSSTVGTASTTSPRLTSSTHGALELSDLSTTPVKRPTATTSSIFQESKAPTFTTQKLMSSVVGYFKGSQNGSDSTMKITQTTSPLANSLRYMSQMQTPNSLNNPSSVLSPEESRELLAKLRNIFEMEVPSLNQRLCDSIQSLHEKSVMIELLMRKLQDLLHRS
ncbi:hypothetical protein SAMD00019534_012190 [Acytostelium subglobosum LB1]|uniref:hypothetical protein n=1 Tax=Acytostelium subglobosum LB1 TaxID=1410327 RepID=UPI00064501AB|nr:hypothetical protein SAMD00019534_012190 [Acytostelium subglobosum LB1]GAM18044.1 hypothetical protein SAMD00019534_012190 [Acytostelium subglobosum LB1]|eukprot:XP_012758640.1 hypothetical protein SAMD00019534_012190 [Acytostelium subglobosum LB1]